MAKQGGNQGRELGNLAGPAQRRQGILRPARFEQDLTLQLKEIGVFRGQCEQGIAFGQSLVHEGFLVEGISAGIARRHALIGFGIDLQRAGRLGAVTHQLRLDPLKAGFLIGIGRFEPRRIMAVGILKRLNPVRGHRVA